MTREELEAAQCWDPSDTVPRRPAMTEFRQRTRLHQARWREAIASTFDLTPAQVDRVFPGSSTVRGAYDLMG